MDGGAWWAAVHRVAQSQTWLKRLSMHACTGEGNGNPLQCSCLESPRERGAWWAAVYGVAQSQTWPKWHSSSSSSWIANGKRSDNTLVSIAAESQWPRREELAAMFSWGTDSPVCYAFHSSCSFPNTQAICCSPAEVICSLPAYFHNLLILNKYFSVLVSLAVVVKRDHEIMGGIIFCVWKNCSICLIYNTPTVQEIQETQVGFVGQEEPLEEGRATHSSILAWRILWTEEPGGLQSIGLQRVGHDWSNLACMYSFVTFLVHRTLVRFFDLFLTLQQ